MKTATQHRLNRELSSIVGEANVIDDEDRKGSYSQDFSPFPPIRPGIIVRPGSQEEVAEILKLANKARNPVIVRGGGASLSGFPDAAPGESIILETRRMNHVLEVDEVNFTARAECGALMSELEEAVAARGLYANTVTIPAKYSTLGGVISGVMGGGLPLNMAIAGEDGRYLLGLKVVLPTGKVLSTGAGGANIHRKSDFMRAGNGPDLTGLFIGDGGVLGVKTEATVQVFPNPLVTSSGSVVFKDFKAAWKALLKLTQSDPQPFIRLSFRESERYVMSYTAAGRDSNHVEECEQRIGEIAIEEGAVAESTSAQYIDSETKMKMTRGLLSFICGKKEFPFAYQSIREFIDRRIADRQLDKHGVRVVPVFNPADRNAVYSSISVIYDPTDALGKAETLQLVKEGFSRLVEMGCCPEPNQGFSSKVIRASWSPEFAEVIKGIKSTLDPNGVLNPSVWDM